MSKFLKKYKFNNKKRMVLSEKELEKFWRDNRQPTFIFELISRLAITLTKMSDSEGTRDKIMNLLLPFIGRRQDISVAIEICDTIEDFILKSNK